MNNAYIVPKHHKNEEAIKQKIVDGYARGVCDRNGGHIPRHKRGASGKGDRYLPVNKARFDRNYDLIDWTK